MFANNLFARTQRSTPTGLRVQLPAAAMPVNTQGQRIGVADYDRSEGFSPGSSVIVHLAGLDNTQALARTGAVGLVDMAQAFAKHQPIVVIDASTGRRQLIWSELDASATGPRDTNLLIHPGKDFTEGHTYIVALRNLRDARGHLISAPSWFKQLRDSRTLPPRERSPVARRSRAYAP